MDDVPNDSADSRSLPKESDYEAFLPEDTESDGLLRDGNESDNDDQGSFVTATQSVVRRQTLFPDDGALIIKGVQFLEGSFSVKLIKFTVLTYLWIVAWYYIVRLVGWENDGTLKLSDMWRYEVNLIFTDIVVFFLVGRLFSKVGVDNLEWMVTVGASNFWSSYLTEISFLQHSATLYQMHCLWPWQLWVFVACVAPLVIWIALYHVHLAFRQGVLVQKCVEMFCINLFLLGPFIGSGYLHLHHWFAGLLLGMHLNFDTRVSRIAMAWCWGSYINGIAVYGRDPVLTCAYALFMAKTQRCPFVQCYIDGVHNETHPIEEMHNADWRNCSDSGYHP